MLRCMGARCCMAALTEGGVPAMQESGQRLTPEEVDRAEMMHKYTLNNAHYFCETADVTRPFPSRRPVCSPSWEFVWNRWLAASLRSQGLAEHCPQLLQVSAALPSVPCIVPACMRLSTAWSAGRVMRVSAPYLLMQRCTVLKHFGQRVPWALDLMERVCPSLTDRDFRPRLDKLTAFL